jgi:hypothetical protein
LRPSLRQAREAIEIVVVRKRAVEAAMSLPTSPYTGFDAENRGRRHSMVDEK